MALSWSNLWKRSTQRRKQRMYRFSAPMHTQRKFLNVHLTKDLKEKYSSRSVPVRVGDTVKILRGRFKGESGKVAKVELKDLKVQIDGIQFEKKDGKMVSPLFQPSNLLITAFDTSDKKRFKNKQTVGDKKNG